MVGTTMVAMPDMGLSSESKWAPVSWANPRVTHRDFCDTDLQKFAGDKLIKNLPHTFPY